MGKKIKMLNEHYIKALLERDDIDFNKFYKEELIEFIEVAKQENKQLKERIYKTNEAIDELLIFNDFNGTTSGIGNIPEELKFYLSNCKTLEEFRKLEKGASNE